MLLIWNHVDEEQVTKQLEMDLLQNEIERANAKILSLERERVCLLSPLSLSLTLTLLTSCTLYLGFSFSAYSFVSFSLCHTVSRLSIASLHLSHATNQDKLREGRPQSPQPSGTATPVPDLEIQLARKDIEIGRLQEASLKLEEQMRVSLETSRKELATLRDKLSAETQRAEQLTRDLAALPTAAEIEEMRKRLHVLQALDTSSAEQSENGSSDMDSVERLFREKVRETLSFYSIYASSIMSASWW